MRLSEADLKRVKRRIGLLWPKIFGVAWALIVVIAIVGLVWERGFDKSGRPMATVHYVGTGLTVCLLIGVALYYLPPFVRQYAGLLRDAREQTKDTVLAAVKDKQEVVWNTGSGSFYYLVFDFGRVEVGKALYEKARRGHLLTLVLSTHGRELLSVSEVEMKTVSE
jgi:ABC-type polysaccharide/polyol phosphate export permease